MRGRMILGLLFACALGVLMCLPFVVRIDPVPDTAALPAPEQRQTALLPAEAAAADISRSAPAGAPCGRTVASRATRIKAPPVCDANGVPVVEISYVRSNYQCFCLTGSGG